MAKEYIAKESTSQAILTKATETDTAVDGIVGKVGETNDSSGSATSGGIFAKLNKVITDTTSLLTRLTTARAASLDRIGSNGDSGNDTLFGVLSQGTNIEPDVKEFLNSTVGTSGFQSLDKMVTGYSPLKSIQTGIIKNTRCSKKDTEFYTDSSIGQAMYYYTDITIQPIDVKKSIVIAYSPNIMYSTKTSNDSHFFYDTCIRILNENTLRVYANFAEIDSSTETYARNIVWAVIEFK